MTYQKGNSSFAKEENTPIYDGFIGAEEWPSKQRKRSVTHGLRTFADFRHSGKGVKDGNFAGGDGEPRLLFDQTFDGMDEAAKQFDALVNEARSQGFKVMSMWDELEFEERLRTSKR